MATNFQMNGATPTNGTSAHPDPSSNRASNIDSRDLSSPSVNDGSSSTDRTDEGPGEKEEAAHPLSDIRRESRDENNVIKSDSQKGMTSKHPEDSVKTTQANANDSTASLAKTKEASKADDSSALSDNENIDRLDDDLKNDLFYKVLSDPLRDRVKKVPKRIMQHIAYTRLVEDRIADLEKRLAEVENKGVVDQDTAAQDPDNEERDQSRVILGLNRVSFEEYKPKVDPLARKVPKMIRPWAAHDDDDRPIGTFPHHLIDIVVGSANDTDITEAGDVATETRSSNDQASALNSSFEAPTSHEVSYRAPDRIRINSSLLLELLENITGQRFTETHHTNGSELKSQVILKPFKLLVVYEKEIRERAKRLAERHSPDKRVANVRDAADPSDAIFPNPPHLPLAADSTSGQSGCENGKGLGSAPMQPMTRAETKRMDEKGRLESKRAFHELEVLLDFMNNDLRSVFDMRRRIDEGSLRSIAFADLWHLFRHGEEICSSEVHSQVYRTLNLTGGRPFLSSRDEASIQESDSIMAKLKDDIALTISCFFYSFDGKDFGPIQESFQIKPYDDAKLITSLPVYPVKFSHVKNEAPTRQEFISRGMRYIELTKNQSDVVHKRYNGLTLDLEQLREEVDSEVIVDTGMALLKNPSLGVQFGIQSSLTADPRETLEFLDVECRMQGCHDNTAIHKDHNIDHKLSTGILRRIHPGWNISDDKKDLQDAEYIICPSWVYGYVLRSRKWVKLNVDLVEDIKEHSGGFDSLVLPKGHRTTLLALVETHSRGNKPSTGQKSVERQVDLVRGKGKGLIILLHGEPGVGKTSTAECVAEHTGRPLFQVTCGDIGESAEAVEKTLENHFQLAHRWGCVLLLDEADVFLMRRNKTDLKRNAIVSVFLRVLEYYSGILFLTTNRVGVFDQAFRSRIHMSFYYPKLNQQATTEIWKMNLDRTQKHWGDSIKITPKDHADILKHAENHFNELKVLETTWNGRQIRNAFQTAIALAEYDAHQAQIEYDLAETPKPALKVAQFERVAEASKHFDEYLRQTAGLEADTARESGERRDDMDEDDIKENIAEKARRAQR